MHRFLPYFVFSDENIVLYNFPLTKNRRVLYTGACYTPWCVIHRSVLYNGARYIPRRIIHKGVLYTGACYTIERVIHWSLLYTRACYTRKNTLNLVYGSGRWLIHSLATARIKEEERNIFFLTIHIEKPTASMKRFLARKMADCCVLLNSWVVVTISLGKPLDVRENRQPGLEIFSKLSSK